MIGKRISAAIARAAAFHRRCVFHLRLPVLTVLAAAVLGSCANDEPTDAPTGGGATAPPVSREMIVLPMRGTIGGTLRAGDLRAAIGSIDLSDDADDPIIVVELSSDGGMLAHVPALVDLLIEDLCGRGEVLVRVTRAHSAAALVMLAFERVVFDPAGVAGAAYVTDTDPVSEAWRTIPEDQRSVALLLGAKCAAIGGHPVVLAHAMQEAVGLWIRPGAIGFAEELGTGSAPDGAEIVAPSGSFLVLNALSAETTTLSLGIAESPEAAATIAGFGERFRRVGADAIEELRETQRRRQAAIERLRELRNLATQPLDGGTDAALDVAARSLDQLERAIDLDRIHRDAAEYLGLDAGVIAELRERLQRYRAGISG